MEPLRRSSDKIGTIQRRLAWPLRKDDTHKSRKYETFCLWCFSFANAEVRNARLACQIEHRTAPVIDLVVKFFFAIEGAMYRFAILSGSKIAVRFLYIMNHSLLHIASLFRAIFLPFQKISGRLCPDFPGVSKNIRQTVPRMNEGRAIIRNLKTLHIELRR
jgi:hypothetical protein